MFDDPVIEDEKLFHIATEELNNGKRRMDLWERACALASDDHDEARFLYTNMRVEQLLAGDDEARPSRQRRTAAAAHPAPAPQAARRAGDEDIAPAEPQAADGEALAIAIPAGQDARIAVDEDPASLVVEFDDTLPEESPLTERLDDPDFDDATDTRYQKVEVDASEKVKRTDETPDEFGWLDQRSDTPSALGGKPYLVYRNDQGDFRAVRQGGSVAALLLTFPWLVSRGLIGTALVYGLLWLVLVGGLLLLALAWSDAGGAPSPAIQALTAAFVGLALVGLLYVPFRHGNRWYRERLERRGFRLQRQIEARDQRQAIERVRPYAR